MSAHTAGPWHVQHSEGFPVCDARGLVVAHPCGDPLEADATLIAAAPELLAALRALLAASEGFDGTAPTFVPVQQAEAQAKAAIAKATG